MIPLAPARLRSRIAFVLSAALVLASLVVALGSAPESAADPRGDVDLIRGPIGPTGCVQCHEKELKAWQQTHHFESKKVLFSKDGRSVVQKLGLKGLPHKQELCQQCHVTLYSEGGAVEPQVTWGVSCESCHGASKNWIEVHGNLTPYENVESEPAEHRAQRLADAAGKGMINPADIFGLASNCFGCHTVPQETLVNKGGHSAGSKDFELLAWSQGEVRHRFKRNNGNREAPAPRRRLLYVVGQMADACGSMLALAKATTDGPFAQAMILRVRNAKAALGRIAAALGEGEIAAAVRAVADEVPEDALAPGKASALEAAAQAVREKGQAFAAAHQDDDVLGKVDALLPTQMRGQPLHD